MDERKHKRIVFSRMYVMYHRRKCTKRYKHLFCVGKFSNAKRMRVVFFFLVRTQNLQYLTYVPVLPVRTGTTGTTGTVGRYSRYYS